MSITPLCGVENVSIAFWLTVVTLKGSSKESLSPRMPVVLFLSIMPPRKVLRSPRTVRSGS